MINTTQSSRKIKRKEATESGDVELLNEEELDVMRGEFEEYLSA